MHKALLPIVWASSLFAQQASDLFHKAPPAVDEALRARITKFFQLHVDGKFRQAEALVAEESKDFFYTANKPKYLGFEIKDIAYTDNFTKAKATVVAKMVIMAPGFLDKPVPVPIPSRWKLEKGEWCWYIDENELNMTPFGKMKGGTVTPDKAPSMTVPSPEEAARMLATGVMAEKDEAELKMREASAAEFTIVNKMPGAVSLALDPVTFDGITAKLDTKELKAGEKAHVNVDWKPGLYIPRVLEFRLRVQPTNQVIRLRAKFVQ